MKLKLFIFETKVPSWVATARDEYAAKLAGFSTFEIQSLKSPSADRDSADVKRRREADVFLQQIDERDYVVLFDEHGKGHKSSEDFAKALGRIVDSGKARAVFCIGGPYGFDECVKARAQAQWSLSALTMNHWIAQLAALEQLYRGFTIIKGIPYHNR